MAAWVDGSVEMVFDNSCDLFKLLPMPLILLGWVLEFNLYLRIGAVGGILSEE